MCWCCCCTDAAETLMLLMLVLRYCCWCTGAADAAVTLMLLIRSAHNQFFWEFLSFLCTENELIEICSMPIFPHFPFSVLFFLHFISHFFHANFPFPSFHCGCTLFGYLALRCRKNVNVINRSIEVNWKITASIFSRPEQKRQQKKARWETFPSKAQKC